MVDEEDQVITIRSGSATPSTQDFSEKDVFNKSWEELKVFDGLGANMRRRTTRKANQSIFGLEVTPKYERESMMQPAGSGGSTSKQINPGKEYMNGYGAFDVITPPHNLYQLANFYDSSFANHAAIKAKVMNTVGGGYGFDMTGKAKQKLADTKGEEAIDFVNRKIDRLKSEMSEWLEKMNDTDSFTTTMRKVVTDLESTGNAYIEIGRTTRGKIGYIGHIPSITMRVRRLRDGYVQIISNKVVYFRNFGANNDDPIGGDPRPNEIIHLKNYSPLNTYYGVPDIASAVPSLIGDQMAEQYNIDYFENKAVPRYIFSLKGARLSLDAEERLFRFLQTNIKGENHRTLYIPLPPDTPDNKVEFNMQAVEAKVQEGSFDSYRKSNRDNILMAHQVPLSKLGSSDSSAVASALSQDRTFRDQVCNPLQQYIERSVSKIISEETDMIELRFNEMNIVDEVQQSTIHKTYHDIGALMPNEIREKIGMPSIKGLNEKKDKMAQELAEAKSVQARNNERVQQSSDGPNAAQGRNPKGSGAKEDGNKV